MSRKNEAKGTFGGILTGAVASFHLGSKIGIVAGSLDGIAGGIPCAIIGTETR